MTTCQLPRKPTVLSDPHIRQQVVAEQERDMGPGEERQTLRHAGAQAQQLIERLVEQRDEDFVLLAKSR